MKDFTMGIQENLHTVPDGVQTLNLLSKLITRNDNKKAIEDQDIHQALRRLSNALLNAHKNNLDTSGQLIKKQTPSNGIGHNISCSTDGNNIESDHDISMSTDSESCDSDDQSEPDIDYQKELLSRRLYYGEYESEDEPSTPVSTKQVGPTSRSTPLASSTMIEDCSNSMLRNNRRRKNRSTPLASSTMMEDLLADIYADQDRQKNGESIVIWSIEDNTDSAELEEYYNRYFDIHTGNSPDSDSELSTGFSVAPDTDLSLTLRSYQSSTSADTSFDASSDWLCDKHGRFPRTSTVSDLQEVNTKPEEQKTKSHMKQTKSRLLFFLQSVKKSITRRQSKEKKRR